MPTSTPGPKWKKWLLIALLACPTPYLGFAAAKGGAALLAAAGLLLAGALLWWWLARNADERTDNED